MEIQKLSVFFLYWAIRSRCLYTESIVEVQLFETRSRPYIIMSSAWSVLYNNSSVEMLVRAIQRQDSVDVALLTGHDFLSGLTA